MSDTPPESTEGKSGRGFGALLLIVVTLVGAAYLWTTAQDEDDTPPSARQVTDVAPRGVEITYEVFGTADSVSITMETPTGTSQATDRSVPLRTEGGTTSGLRMTFDRGDFVYISAQNEGDTGTVTCVITGSDGEEISRASSDGGFTIATCDGAAR